MPNAELLPCLDCAATVLLAPRRILTPHEPIIANDRHHAARARRCPGAVSRRHDAEWGIRLKLYARRHAYFIFAHSASDGDYLLFTDAFVSLRRRSEIRA